MAALNNEGRWIELENLGRVMKGSINKLKMQRKSKSAHKKAVQKKRRAKRVKKKLVLKSAAKKNNSKKKNAHRKKRMIIKAKPVKMMVKQKKTVRRAVVQHSHGHNLWPVKKAALAANEPLNEALRDLNAELKVLLRNKKRLEQSGQEVAGRMAEMQTEELQLRAEISKLMRNLSVLDKKKGALKDKMSDVDKQIEKVKVIRREMEDV
ncbi:MAG TPA: hypothetical protein VJG49_04485 [Candidatus Nanoarchaeia archaeon]|nr:hypothetical protein [Candidatus Nanoarchaeia archaeon]